MHNDRAARYTVSSSRGGVVCRYAHEGGKIARISNRLILSKGADKISSFRKNYYTGGIEPVMTAVCPPPPLIKLIFEFTGRSVSLQLSRTNTSSL